MKRQQRSLSVQLDSLLQPIHDRLVVRLHPPHVGPGILHRCPAGPAGRPQLLLVSAEELYQVVQVEGGVEVSRDRRDDPGDPATDGRVVVGAEARPVVADPVPGNVTTDFVSKYEAGPVKNDLKLLCLPSDSVYDGGSILFSDS